MIASQGIVHPYRIEITDQAVKTSQGIACFAGVIGALHRIIRAGMVNKTDCPPKTALLIDNKIAALLGGADMRHIPAAVVVGIFGQFPVNVLRIDMQVVDD